MKNGNEPDEAAQRVPQPGTIAYAQLKRRQELLVGKPGSQETSFPVSMEPSKEAGVTGSLEGKKEPSPQVETEGKEAGKEPKKEASLERPKHPSVSQETSALERVSLGSVLAKRLRPLGAEQPTQRASFDVTPDEAEIIEELKLRVRRELRIKASKNDIMRAAIRLVGRDFVKNQRNSFLARALPGK